MNSAPDSGCGKGTIHQITIYPTSNPVLFHTAVPEGVAVVDNPNVSYRNAPPAACDSSGIQSQHRGAWMVLGGAVCAPPTGLEPSNIPENRQFVCRGAPRTESSRHVMPTRVIIRDGPQSSSDTL